MDLGVKKRRSNIGFYPRRSLRNKDDSPAIYSSSGGRRMSYNLDIVAFMEEEEHTPLLKELTHRECFIYRCTPLFEVPTDPDGFDELSRMLSKVMSIDRFTYQVEITPVCGLRGSLADHNALKVHIYATQNEQKTESPIVKAFLLGIDTKDLNLCSENTSVLPVMLTSGQQNTIHQLVDGLQVMFDCVITKVTFQHEELLWMLALWSGFETSDTDEKHVILDFKLPDLKNLNTLQLAVHFDDLLGIWKSVHYTSESEFTLKEMQEFFHKLYTHLENVYGINFSSLQLNVFSLPSITLSQSGMINIREVKHLKNILGYLTERFQINFHATPRIGFQIESFMVN